MSWHPATQDVPERSEKSTYDSRYSHQKAGEKAQTRGLNTLEQGFCFVSTSHHTNQRHQKQNIQFA